MIKMNSPNPQSNNSHSDPTDVGLPPIVLDHLPNMPSLLGRAAFKSGYYQLGDILPALSTEINNLRIRQDDLMLTKRSVVFLIAQCCRQPIYTCCRFPCR